MSFCRSCRDWTGPLFAFFFCPPANRSLTFEKSDERKKLDRSHQTVSAESQTTMMMPTNKNIQFPPPLSDLNDFVKQVRPQTDTRRQQFLVKLGTNSGRGKSAHDLSVGVQS